LNGFVSLVGAGPGDPGLITVLGARRIAEADVIVHDRLVNKRLLEGVKETAELIYAGKQPGEPEMTQEEINRLLVELGRSGKRVVRLKGGDPYVFGRGAEEALALHEAGISFEVVPGITSAIAAPSYAGIPVTQRGVASSFAVITGHEDPAKVESSIDWQSLATGPDTLVFLMGLKTLPAITAQLMKHGRAAETPAALVRWGTTPQQWTITGTLADIAERARDAEIRPPVVTVVGRVVELREALGWFEVRPLFGKTVLVTRARAQASDLVALLEAEGAEVIELPAIEIEERSDEQAVERAVEELATRSYSWVVFTSTNGVTTFFKALAQRNRDARLFGGVNVAAIGPGTADELRRHGISADVVPESYVAESLVRALAAEDARGARVLVPRAEAARRELIEGLEGTGAVVDELTLYRASRPSEAPKEAIGRIGKGEVDVVTFASSSTVRNLVALLDGNLDGLRDATVASIGPITSKTARECGLDVAIEAQEHTIPGLVKAIKEHLARQEEAIHA
jgi:uroporphyrinogen III methyltransferase/synthase